MSKLPHRARKEPVEVRDSELGVGLAVGVLEKPLGHFGAEDANLSSYRGLYAPISIQ